MDEQMAFPGLEYNEELEPEKAHNGMTLRDYFAGQALAGFIRVGENLALSSRVIAGMAYEVADAMIRERAKPAQPKQGGE